MANADVLNRLLRPVNPDDTTRWNNFLATVKEDVMWKPNFDGFMDDLDRDYGDLTGEFLEPSAQIWTSILPKFEIYELIQEGALTEFFDRNITLLEKMELKAQNWNYADHVEYEYMNNTQRLVTANMLNNQAVISTIRTRQNQRIAEIQQRNVGRLAAHMLPQTTDQMINRLQQQRWRAMAGKFFFLKLMYEYNEIAGVRNVIFGFIQDTVFQKVFILEGGMKVGVIA